MCGVGWGWGLWVRWLSLEGWPGCQNSRHISRTSFLSIARMALWLRWQEKPDLVAELQSAALLCQPSTEFRATAGCLRVRLCTGILRKLLPFYYRFCLYLLRATTWRLCPSSLPLSFSFFLENYEMKIVALTINVTSNMHIHYTCVWAHTHSHTHIYIYNFLVFGVSIVKNALHMCKFTQSWATTPEGRCYFTPIEVL